jgi:Tfp pilus assembly protein PilO
MSGAGLTRQQQMTLIYFSGFGVCVILSVVLMFNLSASRTALTKLRQEVEQKESQAGSTKSPGPEELSKWSEQQGTLNGLLLPEQEVPQFFEEITTLAADSGIQQRLAVNSEDAAIEPGKPVSPEDTRAAAMGIHRYLVVSMKFQGQYPNIALFLGRLSKLERPIDYRVVDLKRGVPFIEVQLTVNVYKRDTV